MDEMTKQQRFLQRRSRRVTYLFCRMCLQRPPRHSDGICDPCISATAREASGRTSPRTPTGTQIPTR